MTTSPTPPTPILPPTNPRAWFDVYVRPHVEEREGNLLAPHRAQAAIQALSNMAEHYFKYWEHIDPSKVHGARNAYEFRQYLAQHGCRFFQLVWDIAEAHRHVALGRPRRRVTRDDQVGTGTFEWGEAEWGEFFWFGGPQLIVETDDGERRGVDYIIDDVFKMWDRLTR